MTPSPTTRILGILGSTLVAAVLATAPAQAQGKGTIELGAFARTTAFDEGTTLAFGTSQGLAALVGYFPMEQLAIEAGSGFTWTHPAQPPRVRATWRPLRLRVVYHVPAAENFYPLVGVGVVRNSYGDAVTGSDSGLSGLIGFKTYLNEQLAFRSDLHLDLMGSPFNSGASVNGSVVSRHVNWSVSAGVSLDLGTGRERDSDGDGVRDRADLCPDTPAGVSVDGQGCRVDEDRDGVFDEDDLCPLTPAGSRVDRSGCRMDGDGDGVYDEDDACLATVPGTTIDPVGCALDTDDDGVIDDDDLCPNTVSGVSVDTVGCRVDSDGDGVWDESDRCPDTLAGTEVDEQGCQVLFEEEEVAIILEGVTFELSSEELTPEARAILNDVAASLVANPDVRIRVVGHTDSSGDRTFNVDLSQRRAESVGAHLMSRGVAPDRLETVGVGPDQPIATNATGEGRAQNRRVELELIEG